ncbi:PadR family transcriptional regulator [Buchananella hordeovulneris]|uniref:PadR family transcriptional regulator n=1 Tax=Buchananella hordeovulneris TaxID=52770 RepID=UPI0026DCD6B3|nr:PadR family transcriptional regulator [Buchananella hordeovulneris]MDO5081099.1 PadR family transcriptional regulator [Buchananella hordeovulneris]
MSVRYALLALLAAQDQSTYQLRGAFDAATAATWPLNIGQVSTTLARLHRDGLVDKDADDAAWHLTSAGRQALAAWWDEPVARLAAGRDELIIKLALAATTGQDLPALIQRQRVATQRTLHDLTAARRAAGTADIIGRLILDHHLFALEAELRWLDDVEASLGRLPSAQPRRRPGAHSAPQQSEGAATSAAPQPERAQ